MKKINLFVCTIMIFVVSSCQINSSPDTESIKESIVYFKDENTGLCFATINSYSMKSGSEITSFTCVPCDSLKNIQLEIK